MCVVCWRPKGRLGMSYPQKRSLLEQLDRQNNVTRTLLPFVSALPFVDDEVLAKTFGQTIAIRNFLAPIAHLLKEMPEIELPHLEAFLFPSHRKNLTQLEQRAYWRIAQQERRKRLMNKKEPT